MQSIEKAEEAVRQASQLIKERAKDVMIHRRQMAGMLRAIERLMVTDQDITVTERRVSQNGARDAEEGGS
jgi:hypothetical protein